MIRSGVFVLDREDAVARRPVCVHPASSEARRGDEHGAGALDQNPATGDRPVAGVVAVEFLP
jgi:hypothetical protein